jgi:DNA repair protein RecN (Recombination protein N)
MLTRLSIRDVVLIERLDLAFHGSLSVLTGETGAGKSILLDALGLALGDRGQAGLVRAGAERAEVTAVFELPDDHPALTLLAEREIGAENPLITRRVLGNDGRSRAFINDQPVSIGLLADVGAELVEIHGQHETRGLLNAATHRDLLDAVGGLKAEAAKVATAADAWRAAQKREEETRNELEAARRDVEFLRHAVSEIETFSPRAGEEETLADERRFLMAGEKLRDALKGAAAQLSDDVDVEGAINRALRGLERVQGDAAGRFDAAVAALSRAAAECADARAEIEAAGLALGSEANPLSEVEDRLFALRGLARKYDVAPDDLAAHGEALRTRLDAIDDSDGALKNLAAATKKARETFVDAAGKLTKGRTRAAKVLDTAIMKELAALKLEKARFGTRLDPLAEADWGRGGAERVSFEIAANPGAPAGPLNKVASGGELARVMLSLRVVLAGNGAVPTLVFDEVDSGISGATAAAVGERLARLGNEMQVLVVTHSPQVAARGGQHLRVAKSGAKNSTATSVAELVPGERREEIARMLAGASITEEARAAADKLLAGNG